MCNDNEGTACLKPPSFPLYSTLPSLIYQVLEYEYYRSNSTYILSETKDNINFTVFDPQNQTYYLVSKGEIKPLVSASDELENMQPSVLY
jgi:hypothetical protein